MMSRLARLAKWLTRPSQRSQSKPRPTRLRAEQLERRELLAALHTDENWGYAPGGAKDLNTGLVWSDQDFLKETGSGNWTYNGAATHAANKIDGGFDDWRLPTLTELDTAIKHGLLNHVNSYMGGSNYWSSTKGPKKNGIDTYFFAEDAAWNINSTLGYCNAIAVRGTTEPVPHSIPSVRVYSQDLDTAETYGRVFSAVLDTQPSADVTFSITGDPAQGTVSVSSMTFTPANWNLPQKGTVRGVEDQNVADDEYDIILGSTVSADPDYNGINVHDIHVVNHEQHPAVVLVYPGTKFTTESGSSITVDVFLYAMPLGPVHVSLGVDRPGEATIPFPELDFDATNWAVRQSVTITGLADGLPDGDQIYHIVANLPVGYVGGSSDSLTNVDVNGVLATYTSNATNSNITIPSPGTALSKIVVVDSGKIGDLNVTLNINYPINELKVTLIAPDGTRLLLSGAGGTFTNTTFDDEAFPGTIMPASTFGLKYFNKRAIAGTWTLEVVSATRKNVGKIVNWSLNASLIP